MIMIMIITVTIITPKDQTIRLRVVRPVRTSKPTAISWCQITKRPLRMQRIEAGGDIVQNPGFMRSATIPYYKIAYYTTIRHNIL